MENQLVLLKDPNTKPLDWPMGRILEVFPPVVMVLSYTKAIGDGPREPQSSDENTPADKLPHQINVRTLVLKTCISFFT
ncbi:hypothetical protein TNCV_2377731 [Trichonephila clavipes]|nr:hypothetical protein TNCV_2377731 [Trichonephila clavipes]